MKLALLLAAYVLAAPGASFKPPVMPSSGQFEKLTWAAPQPYVLKVVQSRGFSLSGPEVKPGPRGKPVVRFTEFNPRTVFGLQTTGITYGFIDGNLASVSVAFDTTVDQAQDLLNHLRTAYGVGVPLGNNPMDGLVVGYTTPTGRALMFVRPGEDPSKTARVEIVFVSEVVWEMS